MLCGGGFNINSGVERASFQSRELVQFTIVLKICMPIEEGGLREEHVDIGSVLKIKSLSVGGRFEDKDFRAHMSQNFCGF